LFLNKVSQYFILDPRVPARGRRGWICFNKNGEDMFLNLWIFIQIVVESLPISSSGHVMLASMILTRFGFDNLQNDYIKDIDFFLHGPTVAILLFYFFKSWWSIIFREKFNVFTNPLSYVFKKSWWLSLPSPALFIATVDLITAIFWWFDFSNYSLVQQCFLPIGFSITALILYATRYADGEKNIDWSFRDAMILGVVQGLSLLPGISRFASTYGACRLLCRYNSSTAFSVSFLIQFPLICAGFFKGFLVIQKRTDLMIKLFAFQSLFVMFIASLVSYGLLCLVGKLIEKNKLYYFSRYMIIPIFVSLLLCKGI
jgi:undecaprenyl-diphosphatase